MNLAETFRRIGYYTVDYCKGKPVRKHLDELRLSNGNPDSIEALRKQRLNDLVQHAISTTKHYKDYRISSDLCELPVINKTDVRKRYDDFISDKYKKEELVPVTTSGSYGTPFTFYLTKEKKARQTAEVLYYGEWAGFYIGMKHGYIRVTKKSDLSLFLQNQHLMNPINLDNTWLEAQRNDLKKKKLKVIIGYPSAMTALGHYCKERGDRPEEFNLTSFISTSEPILKDSADVISDTFGCKVYNRYSTEEFGVIAAECTINYGYHINESSYIVEMLSLDKDEPVSDGKVGRIIVTDLFSHAMPLIRYDTGDIGIRQRSCSCKIAGPVFINIEGRQVESVFTPEGKRISPFAINGAMRDLDGILQFQFVQKTKKSYELMLVCTDKFIDNTEEKIMKRFREILGENAKISVTYKNTISPQRSGKRPYIRSEIHNK